MRTDHTRAAAESSTAGGTLNPYDYGRPVVDHECFAGRLALLKEVDYSLGLATGPRPQYRHLAITGARGVGKTSLLNQIAYLAGVNGLLAARVELNNELAASQAALFHQILEDIVARLGEHQPLGGIRNRLSRFVKRTSVDVQLNLVIGQLKAARRDAADVPQETLRRSLRDCTAECKRVGRKAILLCIDEADLLAKDETVLQALRNTFQQQEGFLLVLAGREDLLQNLGKVFGPMQRFFDQVTLGPFENAQEVHECLVAPLDESARQIVPAGFAAEVHALTGGRPHLVKLMAFHAYRAMRDSNGRRLRLSSEIVSATLHGAQTHESDEDLKNRLESRLNQPFETDDATASLGELVADLDDGDETVDLPALADLSDEAPIVKLVNKLLFDVLERRASHLFIIPEADRLRVRMRIDGVMSDVAAPPFKLLAAIVSRVKIMARLDIAERRLPQDGRIRVKVENHEVDFSVSTSPSLHGEVVVIAVRGQLAVADQVPLEEVGLQEAELTLLDRTMRGPSGLILVVGPSGSGRSTTLYGLIGRAVSIANPHVISAEVQVMRPLAGVVQYQAKPQIGLTMAVLVRHGLLQNPDVVVVDSLTDAETASGVLGAATERVVLASIAGGDAVAGVSALFDMHADEALIARTLRVVIAQRLVRRVCAQCRGQGSVSGATCSSCGGARLKGQIGVFQVLEIDDRLRDALRQRDSRVFGDAAAKGGLIGLRDAARKVAERGETTPEEVSRVFA